ncbi:XRE family transcriptional regulator [Microbacterium sp. CJ88]|uniref:XRE family transcriptional regulator n=1 Tax=Microbacterium sp. CJ88 TaxID=3445672 RepID=UPI003F657643
MSDAYNGARLETLRHIHGLTQKEFGARLEVTQSQLSRLERGDQLMSAELAHLASEKFGEPIAFFQVPSTTVPLGPAAFRRKSATRAPERDRITALYQEASRVFAAVSEASGYRDASVLRDLAGLEPETAGERFRIAAGLNATEPVRNLTRLLERMGIGVVTELDDAQFAHDRADVSGITMPTARNMRPVVALASVARGDVQRLTIAHEVGHLVLDQDAPSISCSTRSPQERAAYDFGGALLLPRKVIVDRVFEHSTFRDYLTLKSEYGISIAAIIKRAQVLDVISDERARILQIQHSSRGWRFDEPVSVAAEKPLLLKQALAQVYPTSTFARAAHDLGTNPERLHRWAGSTHDGVAEPANITQLRSRRT